MKLGPEYFNEGKHNNLPLKYLPVVDLAANLSWASLLALLPWGLRGTSAFKPNFSFSDEKKKKLKPISPGFSWKEWDEVSLK